MDQAATNGEGTAPSWATTAATWDSPRYLLTFKVAAAENRFMEVNHVAQSHIRRRLCRDAVSFHCRLSLGS
jgi:hypothetical protein